MSEARLTRPRRRVQYETTPVSPAVDRLLTLQAKGLWFYLWTRPDDWTIYLRQLPSVSANGRDATRAAFRELVAAGLVLETKRRTDEGEFDGTVYELVDLFTTDAVRVDAARQWKTGRKTKRQSADAVAELDETGDAGAADGLSAAGKSAAGLSAPTQSRLELRTKQTQPPSGERPAENPARSSGPDGGEGEGIPGASGARGAKPGAVARLSLDVAEAEREKRNPQAALRRAAQAILAAAGLNDEPPTFAECHALLSDARAAFRDRYGRGQSAPSPAAAVVELFGRIASERLSLRESSPDTPVDPARLFELASPHVATWRAYAKEAKSKPPTLDAVLAYFRTAGGARTMASAEADKVAGRFFTRNEATGWQISGEPVVDWRPLADRWLDVELAGGAAGGKRAEA